MPSERDFALPKDDLTDLGAAGGDLLRLYLTGSPYHDLDRMEGRARCPVGGRPWRCNRIRRTADSLHELDGLVRDVTAAKAEIMMIAEGHSTQTLRQALTLLRCFHPADLPPDGFGDHALAPQATAGRSAVRRGGRKPGRPIDEEDVVSRLAAGESVNGIARHLGVDWATINRIKRARPV